MIARALNSIISCLTIQPTLLVTIALSATTAALRHSRFLYNHMGAVTVSKGIKVIQTPKYTSSPICSLVTLHLIIIAEYSQLLAGIWSHILVCPGMYDDQDGQSGCPQAFTDV